MMEIESVMIRRAGDEEDSNAEVVLEVCDIFGQWFEVGRVKVDDNFSHVWFLPNSTLKPVVESQST